MKMEDDIPQVEAEEVEEGVDPRDPGVPVSLVQIAARPNEALEIIESRVAVLKTIRIESIRRTNPEDWVAYRDEKTGREIAYLQDSGCQRVMPLWGIETHPEKDPERTPPQKSADRNEEFAYTVRGDGFCRFTGQSISNVEGTRYSTEKYATQADPGIRREVAVKKAARANFDGTCVRKLTGMNAVPVAELLEAWGNPKLMERISKGRGYGSQAERQGAQVQQTDEIEFRYQPKCEDCHETMKFVPAGKSQNGRPYPAFWSCKNRDHKATVPHEQALAEAKRMKETDQGGLYQ